MSRKKVIKSLKKIRILKQIENTMKKRYNQDIINSGGMRVDATAKKDIIIPEKKIAREDIAERIKQLRKLNGLKQREVANILHISTRAYANYEEGRSLVTTESAIRLAELYKISVDYILCRYN